MQERYRDIVRKVVGDRGLRMAGYMGMMKFSVVQGQIGCLDRRPLHNQLVIGGEHVKIFLVENVSQENNSKSQVSAPICTEKFRFTQTNLIY
jgi:hypothetical protein